MIANRCLMTMVALWPGAIGFAAEGTVINVSGEWRSDRYRRIAVESATASTVLGDPAGQYAPPKACDGDRKSKWVASEAPSKEKPQWIRLDLAGGEQQVTGVAVFGERVDNDGVLDAEIQVAVAGQDRFRTVASVENADSANWLATFEPVKTSAVRLLVTRSAGPTTHTDVYAIEVLGPAMTPAELHRYAGERLRSGQGHLQAARKSTQSLGLGAKDLPAVLRTCFSKLDGQFKPISKRFGQWDSLDAAGRDELVGRIELSCGRAKQLAGRLSRAVEVWPARGAAIRAARDAAAKSAASRQVVAKRDGDRICLLNENVLVSVDVKDGAWDATWLGGAEAVLRRARTAVEVDGKALSLLAGKAHEEPFEDRLGKGRQIKHEWSDGVRVERLVRVYDGRGVVTVSGRITNTQDRDVSLGTTHLVALSESDGGWWHAGHVWTSPAALFVGGSSTLLCEPAQGGDLSGDVDRSYGATQILSLVNRGPTASLTIGYLTALEARPDLSAAFRVCEGGTALSAHQRFLGRTLGPGESIDLDAVYLSAHDDPYVALEAYGDAAAPFAQQPVRKGATALWCSWYAHRMAMTEDLVLANAAVAAKHLKPLGFEIMQLDHGWQRGDVTGDWVPNERFGHGLKWLSDELKSRYGLRLGVWIAPTDVAETSETFKKHADWLFKDEHGKPRVNWRWYWKPNPNCYVLDASHPAAAKWIADVFAQLTAWGVSYYKIDFIASSGGEQFHQHDPKATRGWSVLRRAMEALRRGAGPDAWIRYCQTPPLLSAGLASSVIGGSDTGDAGLGGNIETLRTNARSLAAGYWLNDRWYHREVCDMSVRMQANVEEVRMRLAMMSLAGCSVSFSDEFQYLPPSRIRMMQQTLPPGNPPMRPIDLFGRTIPSVWWVHCKNAADEWDIVGLFNFEKSPQVRTVEFASLGLPADAEVAVFEFWRAEFLGVHKERITLTLPPQTSRILSIRRLTGTPQVIGTDMHVLQGYHEIKRLAWDAQTHTLSGECERMPGLSCKLFVYVPDGFAPHFEFPLTDKSARLTHVAGRLWAHEIDFADARRAWTIPFSR